MALMGTVKAAIVCAVGVIGAVSAIAEEKSPCAQAVEIVTQAISLTDRGAEITQYEKAIGLCPKLPEAHYNLGLALRLQGDRERALQEIGLALDGKDDNRFRNARARLYADMGQHDAAQSEYQVILERSRGEPVASVGLAAVLQKTGHAQEAISILELARAAEPSNESVRYNLGILYEGAHRDREAIDEYTAAYSLQGTASEVGYRLGMLHARRGDSEAAREIFEKVVSRGSGAGELPSTRALARVLLSLGEDQRAEMVVRRGLEKAPEDQESLSILGRVLLASGRYEQALQVANRGLSSKGDIPELLYVRGAAQLRLGKPKEAIDALGAALKHDPKHRAAHYDIAHAYRDIGSIPAAEEHERVYESLVPADAFAPTESP
jgi:tetratricopeptide (TPR) repeat protein